MSTRSVMTFSGTPWLEMYRKPIAVTAWRSCERRSARPVGEEARERSMTGIREKQEVMLFILRDVRI